MFRPLSVAGCALLVVLMSVPSRSFARVHTADKNKPAAAAASSAPASHPLLPEVFSGWQITGKPVLSTDPAMADPASAAVLREFGFKRFEAADYMRDDGTLTVKAIELQDASGAFGAFTFYRQPDMRTESIGQGAAFDGKHVLFWAGAVLVDATLSRVTPMSASELRDLAQQLPPPSDGRGTPPVLDSYLPPQHLEPMTVRYAYGPQAYVQGGGVLPPSLVDFGRSAEVVTGQYATLSGTGSLTLINYPTPQIAMEQERAIQQFLKGKSGSPEPASSALTTSRPDALRVRRSGPIVAVTSGVFTADEAEILLQRVHWETELTLNNPHGSIPDTSKLAALILSIAMLVGIFCGISLVVGIALGGGRALVRKLKGKSASALDETADFIRLHLSD